MSDTRSLIHLDGITKVFYTEEVDRIEDVSSAETFVVYKGFNLKVPYIL